MPTPTLAALWRWLRQPRIAWPLAFSFLPILVACLYAYSLSANAPWRDQWSNSVEVAVRWREGTFTPSLLWDGRAGHIFLLNYVATVLSTEVWAWDAEREVAWNLALAGVNLGLLGLLWARSDKTSLGIGIFVFACLVFAVNQDVNWTTGFMIYSQQANLCLLGAAVTLVYAPPHPRPFVIALLLTILGTFTSGYGLAAWGALPLLLWLQGYRRWPYWVLWGGVALACALLYLRLSGIEVSHSGTNTSYAAVETGSLNLLGVMHFALAYLGGLFTATRLTWATLLGTLGLWLLGLNLWGLWRTQSQGQAWGVWLTLMAYTLANSLVTALGRLKAYDEVYLGLALSTHYGSVRLLFWGGLIVLTVLNARALPKLWLLNGLNLMIGLVLTAFFLHSNLVMLQRATLNTGALLGEKPRRIEGEQCLAAYPLTRQRACFDSVGRLNENLEERVLQLAAFRLTLFADLEASNLLGTAYQEETPVLIATPSPWLNVYVRDWLLAGIPEADFLHLAPPPRFFSLDALPTPPQTLYAEVDEAFAEALSARLRGKRTLWLVLTPETAPLEVDVNVLLGEGWAGTVFPIQAEAYREAQFTLIRYERLPDRLAPRIIQPQGLRLLAWEFFPIENEACRVQTWWDTPQTPATQYIASLRLVDVNGQTIAQQDAPPANIPTVFWEVGRPYFDERLLPAPCTAGRLALGLYTLEDTTLLSLEGEAGALLGDLAILPE